MIQLIHLNFLDITYYINPPNCLPYAPSLASVSLSTFDIASFIANLIISSKISTSSASNDVIFFNLTDSDECGICADESRDSNLICVVEDYKSVIMFEKSGTFKGKYHILNGLISPIDGIYPEDINISSLIERIVDPEKTEVIMAIKPSVEGEATSLYIKKILESKKVKVSRLSYGIPVGVDIDYLDSITLDRALLDRKEITD